MWTEEWRLASMHGNRMKQSAALGNTPRKGYSAGGQWHVDCIGPQAGIALVLTALGDAQSLMSALALIGALAAGRNLALSRSSCAIQPWSMGLRGGNGGVLWI